MADTFNSSGLTIQTRQEILDGLIEAMRAIYGDNINLEQDTPDGQILNIIAQSGIDIREVLAVAVASFDPDQAEGRILDQRVALNGIYRKAGKYTMTYVSITTDRAVTLQGLDDKINDINGTGFSIKDGIGNIFILAETQNIAAAGTYSLLFRAREIGAVQVLPNTITMPETIVPGVTAINNPQGVTQQGTDEESDAELKARRRASLGIASRGMISSLRSGLLNIDSVTDCQVIENNTNATSADGVPPHSVWCIVEGGAEPDIGQTIYAQKSDGCGTYGSISVVVNIPDQDPATYYFDRPEAVPLHIQFSCGYFGGGTIDAEGLQNFIAQNLQYRIRQIASADKIIPLAKQFDANYYVKDCQISTDGETWSQLINPATPQQKFIVSTENITITEL